MIQAIEFARWQTISKKGGDAVQKTRKGESQKTQQWLGNYLVSIFRIGG